MVTLGKGSKVRPAEYCRHPVGNSPCIAAKRLFTCTETQLVSGEVPPFPFSCICYTSAEIQGFLQKGCVAFNQRTGMLSSCPFAPMEGVAKAAQIVTLLHANTSCSLVNGIAGDILPPYMTVTNSQPIDGVGLVI